MPRVNVRVNQDLYGRLAQAANDRRHPISRWVRDAVASTLAHKEESGVAAAEERIAATLDRFARDIRRLHSADQALYAAFDTFVRLFLTCILDPPPETLTAAKVQGQRRYQNYLQNVARNLKGDARALGS